MGCVLLSEEALVLVLLPDREPLRGRAIALARRLGLGVIRAGVEAGGALILACDADGLELRDEECRVGQGLRIDLEVQASRLQQRGLSRRQPLAKAIGSTPQTVVEATAGLGQDALLLAALGHEVVAFERHPVLAAMLRDALDRLAAGPERPQDVVGRIQLIEGDARGQMQRLVPAPHVVYLDPMFPPKRKRSALPRKSIRIVRRLVGEDADAVELLAAARRAARRRVVVKRPPWAAPLAEDAVSSHGGKLARYDVYLPEGLSDEATN